MAKKQTHEFFGKYSEAIELYRSEAHKRTCTVYVTVDSKTKQRHYFCETIIYKDDEMTIPYKRMFDSKSTLSLKKTDEDFILEAFRLNSAIDRME